MERKSYTVTDAAGPRPTVAGVKRRPGDTAELTDVQAHGEILRGVIEDPAVKPAAAAVAETAMAVDETTAPVAGSAAPVADAAVIDAPVTDAAASVVKPADIETDASAADAPTFVDPRPATS